MFTSIRETAGRVGVRRAGIAATALGASAAALVLAAPAASANVSSVAAKPGITIGSNSYGTGCSYEVVASVNNTTPVYFYDNGVFIGPGPATPNGGVATITWTPTTPGSHTLSAQQGPNWNVAYTPPLTVGAGMNLGSVCLSL
jgi:hypothetical protein